MAQTDREALVAFYNATDGDNWKNKTNWDSGAPLSDWYGVTANDEGRLVELNLSCNNLQGIFQSFLRYCSLNTRHLYTTSVSLACKCFLYTAILRYRFLFRARIGLLSYFGAVTTTNPFRTGLVGLMVGFLADIHPLTLSAAMYAKGLRCVVIFAGRERRSHPGSCLEYGNFFLPTLIPHR